MSERKINKKYCFTVESETEKWYLDWLQDKLNEQKESLYKVSIISKVQQNTKKYAKTVNAISTPEITHWCDYESNEKIHEHKFKGILEQLKESNSLGGKKLKYKLGYSKFTIDNKVPLSEYKGFKYYKDNLSLTISESIEKILCDCNIVIIDPKTKQLNAIVEEHF